MWIPLSFPNTRIHSIEIRLLMSYKVYARTAAASQIGEAQLTRLLAHSLAVDDCLYSSYPTTLAYVVYRGGVGPPCISIFRFLRGELFLNGDFNHNFIFTKWILIRIEIFGRESLYYIHWPHKNELRILLDGCSSVSHDKCALVYPQLTIHNYTGDDEEWGYDTHLRNTRRRHN